MPTSFDKRPIRVIVIDDSHFIRQTFTSWLNNDPAIEVVAAAADPFEARELIKQHNPDVITLDIEMPKMDGISFLEKVMRLRPMPVVMASTLTAKGADITLKALEMGAVDYITKPSHGGEGDWDTALTELSVKVKQAAKAQVRSDIKKPVPRALDYSGEGNSTKLIAIGASTGGVEAITEVLEHLPANMPPILIAQHMPPLFTDSFAKRLDSKCALKVMEAKHQQKILPGHVYIAPGAHHLRIQKQSGAKQFWTKLDDGPLVSGHRPSVDVLFQSFAENVGANTIGVILTGMGSDGAKGLLELKENGATTIGQNETSCTVYGMPRAAKQLGAVSWELPLRDIAQAIIHSCEESTHDKAAHR